MSFSSTTALTLWKVLEFDLVPDFAERLCHNHGTLAEKLVLFPSVEAAVEGQAYAARRVLHKTPTAWASGSLSVGHQLYIPSDRWGPARTKKEAAHKEDHKNLVAVSVSVKGYHDAQCADLPQGGAAYVFTSGIRVSVKDVFLYKLKLETKLENQES